MAAGSSESDDAALARRALCAALGLQAPRFGLVEVASRIDSTNSELLRRGFDQPDSSLLLALSQSSGRGRQGRRWDMPNGGQLALSLAFFSHKPLSAWATLPLAVGVELAESLAALGVAGLRLKWPNDLLVNAAKLGGILLETRLRTAADGSSGCLLVIGVGINRHVGRSPQASDYAVTDLFSILGAATPSLAELGACVAVALNNAVDQHQQHGFSGYPERFARVDALANSDVDVRMADGRSLAGRALGITDDGQLRVLVDGREHRFISADVSLRWS